MNTKALGVALILALLGTQRLVAQQPQRAVPKDSAAPGMMEMNMQQPIQVMDSMNARLDALVHRMNRTTGNAKVAAMAQVINELVAQRRAMQTHMHQMMQSHRKRMGGQMMMGDSGSTSKAGRERARTDTSGHAEHHPEN